MSAQLVNATATFNYQGASVTLACSSPTELLSALAQFGLAANDAPASLTGETPSAARPTPPTVSPTPAPTSAPVAQAAAGNAPASTPTPASAQPAASGSASGGDAHGITYDQVRDKTLAMVKVCGRETAAAVLGKFKTVAGAAVDHGNKLQLPDYPAFITAAKEALAAKGAA